MEQIQAFINDPLVSPLYGLLVVAVIGMLLGMYRAFQQGTFDWKKIPGILDDTVLKKIIPLAAMGVASFMVAPGPAQDGLKLAYGGLVVAAYADEVKSLIDKVTGSFVATTKAQDKGIATGPTKS